MFGWFGAEKKLDNAVANLVTRARAGDQNATAIIVQVRVNKDKNKKAAKTFGKLTAYVKAHPVGRGIFGKETTLYKTDLETIVNSPDPVAVMACIIKACRSSKGGVFAACIALANGPALEKLRLTELSSAMGNEPKETAFRFGIEHHRSRHDVPPEFAGHMGLGQIVGRARGLQIVRSGGPIAALSPAAAIELGDRRGIASRIAQQVESLTNAPNASDNTADDSSADTPDNTAPSTDEMTDAPEMQTDEQERMNVNDDGQDGPSDETLNALLH